ncbi:chondroitin proteoglycan-2-like [Nymphalis io]|uniref:chondroitin proteoglycan-2-like n=1 Tax=Inachis io TaxID=171585 RepID=UPI00216A84F0|nr:chondroitin proteoglycan-2-like [Nymphalis io]
MKVAALLLVCAISLAQGNDIELNENGCPIDHTIEKLYPHENCNKFYQCTHGNLVVKKCASNLFFDVEKQECDWSETVDCGDRVVPDEKEDEDCDENENENGDGNEDGDDNNGSCNCNPGEAPSICGREGSDGVLIAHENCNQFYKCFNGKPVTVSCPGNLLYNPHKEICDWPENVECGDRVIPECDDNNNDNDNGGGGGGDGGDDGGDDDENDGTCNCNPGEAPSICGQEGSDGVLVAHENCNQFYKCFNGKPVAMKCPGTLLYNPYRSICDWPENVDCGDRVIPEPDDDNNDNDNGGGDGGDGGDDGGDDDENDGTCNCNPGEAPSICGQEGSDGVLVAHENCNQFYKCFNGKPVAMKCPGTLLYNPYRRICDWPENVDCGDRVIPEPDDDNNDNDNGGGDGGDGGDDGGDDDENDGTCNCNPGEAPSICGQEGSDGVLVAHENCNQFYKCFNGKPVAMKCPGTLLYNPYRRICDWPENVDCGDRVIPEPDDDNNDNDNGGGGGGDGGDDGGDDDENDGTCNCNPGEAPSICGQEGSDGVLVAHENCNQFYKCFNGKPVAMKCPGTLLYNPYRRICDWPENVDCGDRVIPEPDDDNNDNDNGGGDGGDGGDDGGDDDENDGTCNCNPGEAPSICGQEGSDGVLVAHENCTQFYKCSNGKPVAMKCPGTLLYNPYRRICDWPENVDCGDRVIPECDDDTNDNDNGGGDGGDGGDDENDGTCNCNPGEAPSICGQEGSDGFLVAHENCYQFYKCFNNKPVSMDCPVNLLYNPYKQICDWPEKVKCGDRIESVSMNKHLSGRRFRATPASSSRARSAASFCGITLSQKETIFDQHPSLLSIALMMLGKERSPPATATRECL